MENLIAVAVVSGTAAISFGLALAIECCLLEVILRFLARARADEKTAGEASPEGAYRELRKFNSVAEEKRA